MCELLTLIRVDFELTSSSESHDITRLRIRFILLSGLFLTSVILVSHAPTCGATLHHLSLDSGLAK